jgi:hypothetical protein
MANLSELHFALKKCTLFQMTNIEVLSTQIAHSLSRACQETGRRTMLPTEERA